MLPTLLWDLEGDKSLPQHGLVTVFEGTTMGITRPNIAHDDLDAAVRRPVCPLALLTIVKTDPICILLLKLLVTKQ